MFISGELPGLFLPIPDSSRDFSSLPYPPPCVIRPPPVSRLSSPLAFTKTVLTLDMFRHTVSAVFAFSFPFHL